MRSRKTIVLAALVVAATMMVATPQALAQGCDGPQVVARAADCCPRPCITYRHHRLHRHVCCSPCVPPMKMVLELKDPCSCAAVQVPVCVPGCCTTAPCVATRCGLFGRKITEYSWCCGFKIKIVETRRGDLVVHYYGTT